MALTWDDLAFTVVFNCGIALVCFIIFNVMRRLPFLSHFYMAKRYMAIPFRCASQRSSHVSHIVRTLCSSTAMGFESTIRPETFCLLPKPT